MTTAKRRAVSLAGTGLCVCHHLRRTSRAVTRLYDTALRPVGLRATQFAVLVAVAKRAPLTASSLEELLGMDQTTVSRSLRTLKRAGHLTLAVGTDRRERLVSLTARGQRALRKAVPHWRRIQRAVVSQLVDPEWISVEKHLRAVKGVSDRLLI